MKNICAFFLSVVLCIGMTAACTTTLFPQKQGPVDYQKQFQSAYAQLRIAQPAQRPDIQPVVLAHYMPWFQKYGFHWQEGGAKFDPAQILPDGRANIASHYYPLTGNYDSADPLVLEYQLALMKMAGIDGVIFDWYGITEGIDYKPIQDATVVMADMIKERNMQFAVCYEDQSIQHLIEFGIVPADQGRAAAKDSFDWMAQHWFPENAYVKAEGRPLVLCFGPQYFYQKADWDAIFSDQNPRPFFIDLDGRTNWADGTMNWSPMHLSTGGRLGISTLVRYLNDFYGKQESKPFVVGTAVPAFHDIYAQAGARPSYGYLDFADGETFKLTWTAARNARANVIQIQTWNDYGEGTVIEPTIERGYTCLEFLQDEYLKWKPDFPFNYSDLRIPIELYKIAASDKATDDQKKQVAAIYDMIFSGDAQGMRQAVRAAGIHFDFSVSPLLLETSPGAGTVAAFDPAGKKNLALGKPATASSRIDVWTAGKAVDGDTSSYWEGAARAWPGTLQVDLQSQVKISTVVIKLNPQRMWAKRTQRVEVKTSGDNQNWITAAPEADYTFDPAANANTAVIPVDVTARYVQLVFTANSGATNGQVAEFEVYGE
ncbi:MAG: discoidin domain-containing protein [Treponema sp.]|nr:discoidin domain-containing protein [Treponema sp.]